MKPLLSPAQAARLLDEVIYERVVDAIDLRAIHAFECELSQLLLDLGPMAESPLGAAKVMIEAALARLPSDPRRYLSPGGYADDDCPLCSLDADAPDAPDARRPEPAHAARDPVAKPATRPAQRS